MMMMAMMTVPCVMEIVNDSVLSSTAAGCPLIVWLEETLDGDGPLISSNKCVLTVLARDGNESVGAIKTKIALAAMMGEWGVDGCGSLTFDGMHQDV